MIFKRNESEKRSKEKKCFRDCFSTEKLATAQKILQKLMVWIAQNIAWDLLRMFFSV